MEEETYVVYALCEPDTGLVRYVGVTLDLEQRMYAHLRNAWLEWKSAEDLNKHFQGKPFYTMRNAKDRWLMDLFFAGKQPGVKVLQWASEENRLRREAAWIWFYSQSGQLLNLVNNKEKLTAPLSGDLLEGVSIDLSPQTTGKRQQ